MRKKKFPFPQELWDAYWASRSDAARNVLAEYYLSIPIIWATKIHGKFWRHVQHADLVQAGSMGLMQAIASFDPSNGAQFLTHAGIRIHGAMIDYVRDQSLANRTTMKLMKKINNAELKLLQQHSRPPTIQEIETEIGKSLDSPHGRFALDPAMKSLSSLKYANHEGTPSTLAESIADPREGPAEIIEHKMFVEDAVRIMEKWVLENMNLSHAIIFKMRFRLDSLMYECAEAVGLSESRASQMVTYMIARIRMAVRHGELNISGMMPTTEKIKTAKSNKARRGGTPICP